jgi:hypothetical protein
MPNITKMPRYQDISIDSFKGSRNLSYKIDKSTLYREDRVDSFRLVYVCRATLDNLINQDIITYCILPYIDSTYSRQVAFNRPNFKSCAYIREKDEDPFKIDRVLELVKYMAEDVIYYNIIPYLVYYRRLKKEIKRKRLIKKYELSDYDRTQVAKYEKKDRSTFAQDKSKCMSKKDKFMNKMRQNLLRKNQDKSLQDYIRMTSTPNAIKYEDMKRLDDLNDVPRYYYNTKTNKIHSFFKVNFGFQLDFETNPTIMKRLDDLNDVPRYYYNTKTNKIYCFFKVNYGFQLNLETNPTIIKRYASEIIIH